MSKYCFIFALNLKTNKMSRTKKVKAPVRPIHEIAREITKDWGNKVNFGAVPYLGAMRQLTSIDESYGQDSGKMMVTYFLCNASSWRGDVARRVKKELNAMIK